MVVLCYIFMYIFMYMYYFEVNKKLFLYFFVFALSILLSGPSIKLQKISDRQTVTLSQLNDVCCS